MSVAARALGSRYELESEIGSGAMGRVWRARDRVTNEVVAAKILHERFSADVGVVTRFLQERTILQALDHPNVVRVRDLVVEGNQLAIVMDLVEGSDLRHALSREGVLTPAAAAGFAADTLDGLAHAHAMSVLHRDVKPDNILLDGSDPPRARLSDFSIARLAQETTVRMTGLLGTAEYMAPEILTGTVSAASDVYGTGITLYELLAGFTPFAGSAEAANAYAVARRHETALPPRLEGVPDLLWRLVEAMLAKTPAQRPSAAAAGAELRRLVPELAGLSPLPHRASPEAWDPAPDGMDSGPVSIRSATVAPDRLDPQRTMGGETAPAASPMPVAGASAAPPAAPDVDAPLTQLGEAAPVRPALDVPVVVPRPPSASGLRRGYKVAIGVGAAAAIAALVLVLVGSGNGRSGGGGPTEPEVTRITAAAPVETRPTGLTVQRSAEYDPDAGRATVTVTWTSAPTLTGPFLESVPAGAAGEPCPAVSWQGVTADTDTTEGVPDRACGHQVDVGTLDPEESATGTYTVPLVLQGPDKSVALAAYLTKARTETQAALARLGLSDHYPVQRLADLHVRVPELPTEGSLVSVVVTPRWITDGRGASPGDEMNELFSTEHGASPALDKLGGRQALVLRSGNCSQAFDFRETGPVARSRTTGCTITAQLGHLVDTTDPFSIKPRGS